MGRYKRNLHGEPLCDWKKMQTPEDQTEMADGDARNRIHYLRTGITDRYQISLDVRDGCH